MESALGDAGIRVTDKGEMSAETIDKNMHIDTHYGAIASKAVKLKPAQLNVPGSVVLVLFLVTATSLSLS